MWEKVSPSALSLAFFSKRGMTTQDSGFDRGGGGKRERERGLQQG